jgi:hypothetical protein
MKRISFLVIAVTFMYGCHSNTPATHVADTSDSTTSITTGLSEKIPGPDTSVMITEAYAKLVARDAYFWAWPMVNIYNRRLAFTQAPKPGLIGGILPFAPLNRIAMLHDYVESTERQVACPNQDVVYGGGVMALDISPAVVQVPDFGDRFWVFQIVDMRTDGFAELGAMYKTAPGFYLLVGPEWNGTVPEGITKVFHSKTNTAFVVPRVFMSDDPEDLKKVQEVIQGINVYPLAEFDSKMKMVDWTTLPSFPAPAGGSEEAHWVFPDKFFDQLPAVLHDALPLPGEEARYAQVLAVIEASKKNPALKTAMIEAATEAEEQLVKPVFEFRNFGKQLPDHWSTINNGAAFGTDYFTRTATAKSNILVNATKETKYFYQDLDEHGVRLNSANNYTVTFAKGKTPPVHGFWSLTLYNKNHFFEPNELKRFSLGTKNKNMKYNADGSLTLYIRSTHPPADQIDNWIPSPKKDVFTLYLRTYWPDDTIVQGSWTPPAVVKVK